MLFRGVIFDLDGTIADTLPVCFAAFREVFLEVLGREYSDQEIRAMFGPSEAGVLRRLIPDRWEESLEHYLTVYQRTHNLCTEPFPGMRTALKKLQERGVRLGIVTGKGPRSAAISLRALGLAGVFDPVQAGSANGGIKPLSMRKVIKAWGLRPQEVASLGDAPPDIHSAREIGVTSLAAAWAPTANFDVLNGLEPEAIFERVEEFIDWIERNVA